MSCHACRDKLSSHLDGVLTVEDSRAVEAHMATCEDCRAEYASLAEIVGDLARLEPVPVPDDLMDELRAAFRVEFDGEVREQVRPQSLMERLGGYRIAAGLAALAFTTAVIINERRSDVAPAAQQDEIGRLDRVEDAPAGDDDSYLGRPPEESAAPSGAVEGRAAPAMKGLTADKSTDGGDSEDERYRWRSFERYYDGLVGSLENESKSVRKLAETPGVTADAGAIRLLRAARDVSKEGGLESPPGASSFGVVEGFLGAEDVVQDEKAGRAREEREDDDDVVGSTLAPMKEAQGDAGKRARASEPVQCYFVFGADAGDRLRKAASSLEAKIEVMPIASLGAVSPDRAEAAAAVGDQISVTLPEASARELIASLQKDDELGLRLFAQSPRFSLAQEPAEAAPRPKSFAKKDREAPPTPSRRGRDHAGLYLGLEPRSVTIHFIVPR